MSLNEMRQYFLAKNSRALSLWFWYYLKTLIYRDFQENNVDEKSINIALLYNWIVRK